MGRQNIGGNWNPKNTYYTGDVPESGVFNPYSVIDASNYKNNRKGKKEYQHDLAELQYLAELRQQEYERQYNSESAQIQRMREAGLNPDLLGVEQGTAGSAPTTNTNPMEGIATNGERASQVVGNVTSIIGTVASLVSGAVGVVGGIGSAVGQGIQNVGNALNVADTAMNLFSNWSAGDPAGMNGFVNAIPLLGNRDRKRLQKLYNQWSGSPYMEKKAMEFEKDVMESTGEFYKRSVDPRYNSPDVAGYVEAWTPLVDALNELAVQETKGKTKRAEYDQTFYGNEAGTSDRGRRTAENEMFGNIRGPLIEVLQNFEKMQNEAKEGSKEYETALYSRAFLSGIILKMFSGM